MAATNVPSGVKRADVQLVDHRFFPRAPAPRAVGPVERRADRPARWRRSRRRGCSARRGRAPRGCRRCETRSASTASACGTVSSNQPPRQRAHRSLAALGPCAAHEIDAAGVGRPEPEAGARHRAAAERRTASRARSFIAASRRRMRTSASARPLSVIGGASVERPVLPCAVGLGGVEQQVGRSARQRRRQRELHALVMGVEEHHEARRRAAARPRASTSLRPSPARNTPSACA